MYVAGSARQADLVALKAETTKAADAAAVADAHATQAGQQALTDHDAHALALEALVGLLARERARGAAAQRDAAEAAAQLRFKQAMREGLAPAAAIRSALK